MAQDKVFNIQIGGVKESITNLESLESVLASLESKVKNINDKGGFSVANKESAKAMDELGKLTQKITQYDEEYQRAVEASKGVLKDKNNEVKQAIELEKASLVIEENAKSTYNEKQQLLSALGKTIKSMSTDTEENKQKQQELIAQYAELNQELKDFDASLGNHQRNVGDYGQATKNLKKELKELQSEMATMISNGVSKADPAFVSLAKRAGEMKDALNDAGEEVKRFASDTKKLDDVINVAKSATAAFELYKGAMSAFGMETEQTEEAIQKLMGAMSIIQSLQTLSETLQNGSATAKIYHKMLQLIGLESKTAAASVDAMATSEKAATVATDTLTLSTKALKLALASIGIGLVLIAVGELIEHWEDLCNWFDKTFPIVKKVGGVFNWLKAVAVGLGKSILDYLVNPFKTFANVVGKILQGDFEGAWKAAVDGIKKQATIAYTSFVDGYKNQVEKGLEEMTKKAAAEQAKQTKYELDMLKARKGNQAKYSKEGIALQKKEFEQRRKAAKGNEEELKKIALDEANFFRECEEQKTAAAKKSSAARVKANKDAAAAAKKAAQEAAEAQKKAIESFKKKVQTDLDFVDALNEETKTELSQIIKEIEVDLDKYASGPIEKYIDKLEEWKMATRNLEDANNHAFEESLWKEYIEKVDNLGVHFEDHFDFIKALSENYDRLEEDLSDRFGNMSEEWESWGLTEEQEDAMELILLKYENFVKKHDDFLKNLTIDSNKKIAEVQKNELDDLTNDAERAVKRLQSIIKDADVTPVIKNNTWGKLFGVIDEQETLKKYEKIKAEYVKTYNELQGIIAKEETKWDEYLVKIGELYGEDSRQYKKANQQKIDALEELRKKALEVAKVANKPVSLGGDLNGDNTPDAPSGGTVDTNGKIQQGLGQFNDFMTKINDTLLAPMMDTFSMFMDFAIEETAQKLEQVEELHDKALDKVNESADKIKELNDELKDSGNTNLEATKQQLADEQLLYAQRLAEERKLADEEKALKNKQAQQEANARKMELRYQMIMAIANTAQGASKALATWGWPLGAVFAGVMAALGAIQVALIAKQISAIKPVKYAEGGIINAPSHAQGGARIEGTNLEVEGGEMVINKRDTNRYKDVLYKINNNDPSVRYLQGNTNREFADTKIRKYANGGQLNFERADANLQASTSTNKLMSAINDIDMQPIVAVKDIWKAENRLVRVRGLAGHE